MSSLTRNFVACLGSVAVVIGTGIAVPAAAAQPEAPCSPGRSSCVIIGVGLPGAPGAPGNPGTGGQPTPPDACVGDTGYAYTACTVAGMYGLNKCLPLYEQNQMLAPAELNALLRANGCPAASGAASPSPARLAQSALAGFVLPSPSGHRSPSESLTFNGFPFTYVNLWVYFWTDPATWRTLSGTARIGAVWARVTATPVSLSYDPGDGSPAVACAGPGRAWTDADGNDDPSDGACGYRYTHVSAHPLTSTQTITWRLSWTGSGGTDGTFPDRTTSTQGQLQVMQIQTVVVHR